MAAAHFATKDATMGSEQRASCCAPSRDEAAPGSPRHGSSGQGSSRQGTSQPGSTASGTVGTAIGSATSEGSDGHRIEQCVVPAGLLSMGDHQHVGYPADGELPVHTVDVDEFRIDATTVTNDDFAAFVDATGYETEAERWGFSAVFHLAVPPDTPVRNRPDHIPWWCAVDGADWRHPEGPSSDLADRGDHPVVHVAFTDALAYCRWAGRRLPTEIEWEAASRGGHDGWRYPWGNDLLAADGAWRCNIWQGTFPTRNTADDGWVTTAPVRTFEPNDFGLWQTVGNVWEWCSDVFDPTAYPRRAGQPAPPKRLPPPDAPRTMRGGSYLCHDSYCNRYRNAARSGNTPDSSMGNTGFRTVARD